MVKSARSFKGCACAAVTEEVSSIEDLKGKTIGQEVAIADAGTGDLNILESTPAGNGSNATAIAAGDEIVGLELLEAYPEFPGGQSAFLNALKTFFVSLIVIF